VAKTIAVALACCLLTPVTSAQVNVFVGYSFARADLTTNPLASHSGPAVATGNLNGWNASVEGGRLLHLIGLVFDFSGHYGSTNFTAACTLFPGCPNLDGHLDAHLYNYLVGPQISFSIGRVKPFAHVLVGGSSVSEHLTSPFVATLDDASLADAIGGGVDYHVGGRIDWRVQADYVQTRFFGNTQNDARISTGIVVRF
jgi:hypothetical protein